MKTMYNDYYEVLGVPRDATEEEIRRSYRKLIKRYHPDLNPADSDSERKLRDVVIAYQTLGDRRKKADYDRVIALFGPPKIERHNTSTPPVNFSSGFHQTQPLVRRRKQHRGIAVGWTVLVVIAIAFILQWQNVSERLFGIWPITPAFYSDAMDRQEADPAAPFRSNLTLESQWYLRFRMQDYQMMDGEMGSARGLAEAYMDIAKNAYSRHQDNDAMEYARLAGLIDPVYAKSQWFYRRLRNNR